MAERKNLTITGVEEIKKVGAKQIPKLSFKAKDGDKELSYFTFKSSLFESIKEGQTINADVEVSTREWEGQGYTDRRIVQIYVDGQPLGGKGGGQSYRGKSPEELELSARAYALSYAKDLAVADRINLNQITIYAQDFYNWLKKNGAKAEPKEKPKDDSAELWDSIGDFKNPGEFYTACLNEFKLSKSKVDAELVDFDLTDKEQRKRAWETIIAIYGHRVENE